MPKYIDATPLINKLESRITNPTTAFINNVLIQMLEKAPAADVVEVVRCKDCQHARQTVYGNYRCLVDHRLAHEETDYCSYGEKKEGAE